MLAVPVGLLAAAILVVNNVRDMDSDKRAGQAHARRAARARARRGCCTRVDGLRRLRRRRRCRGCSGSLSPWLLLPWLTLPLAVRLVRHRARARRRADAQRGARADRPAAARVLRAAERGHPRELSGARASRDRRERTLRLPDAARDVVRRRCASATLLRARHRGRRRRRRARRGRAAGALRRRVATARVARRARGLPRGARGAATAWTAASCSTPAAPPTTSRRRWPPSTSRCGIAPAGARACPVADAAGRRRRSTQSPVNATIGAADRAGAAAAAAGARAAGFGCVKLKVGVGDDAGRVAAVRAALGPDVRLRLDANGAWSVEEAVRTIEALAPAGLELVEEPVHGLAALRAVRERVAGADRDGRDGRRAGRARVGRGRRGLPEARALRRHLRRCSRRRRSCARPAPSLRRLDVRRAARDRRRAALRRRAAGRAPCGLATLGLLDLPVPGALHVRDGVIAVPAGPGLF